MTDAADQRNRLFISYSHHDGRWLKRLRVHLRPLEREHGIVVWDDTQIRLGSHWREELAAALDSAKAAILLVSADFLASEFIVDNELPPLLAAAAEGGMAIFPVVVSPCRFHQTPGLADFQSVNPPSRPLAKMPIAEQEAVWVHVADAVEAALVDRRPEEGWTVANEREVLDKLTALVEYDHSESFLIVSSGPYYLQFLYNDPEFFPQGLYCEAVSSTFLPEELQLTNKAIDTLRDFGFDSWHDEGNYYQIFDISDCTEDLQDIAKLAVEVFNEVYRISHREKLNFQLDLEG